MTGPSARLATTAVGSAPAGAAALRHARAFLAWWGSELADLLPDAVKIRFSGETGRSGLVLEGDTLRLADLRGGQSRSLRDIDLAGMTPAETRSAIGRALEQAGLRGCPMVLGLPESLVLRHRDSLPAGSERRLAEILRLKLESTAPLPPGGFHWGYRIAGPAEDGRLPVECVLVKAEAVDGLMARMNELGIELAGIYPADDLPAEPTLNLMPAHLRREPVSLWSPLNRGLAALAGVLTVLVLAMGFYRQGATLNSLNAELAGLRDRAQSVLSLRTEAQARLQSLEAVREAKRSAPPLMGILDEISRLLPDGTWVSDLRLKGGEVRITGHSQAASSLIGLIESSAAFANVRFGSPVVRDQRTGAERFNIQFEWSGPAAETSPESTADGGGR